MRAASIGAGKPSHGEFDAIAGKLAPGLDLRHIGGLGKAAKYLTRLFPRLLARQREGLAAECVARPRAQRFRGAASDVGGTPAGAHDTPHQQCNAERGTERVELAWDRACVFGTPEARAGHLVPAAAASAIAATAAASSGNPAAIHASSAAASAAPRPGPFGTPRAMKSAALSGNVGALQRAGSVASRCQRASAAPWGARVQASSTRSVKRSGPSR